MSEYYSQKLSTVRLKQVTLTIAAPNQVPVMIDGTTESPGPVTVNVSPGMHTLSVPQTIGLQAGSQLVFDHWSDGSRNVTHTYTLDRVLRPTGRFGNDI